MSTLEHELQRDWDDRALHGQWPGGRDNRWILARLDALPEEVIVPGVGGPVLEVGAAHATYSWRLSRRGFACVALEPSPTMLERAREQVGAAVGLVRGIGEALPFRDRSFGQVLCWSTLDHFAEPDRALAEAARVLHDDGRLVIGIVNYGGVAVRASRVLYGIGRRLGMSRGRRLFWDSPVPIEHTFECTYPRLLELGGRAFALDRAWGVSLGWAVPGWRYVLRLMPLAAATRVLELLDGVARDRPALADYIVSVWRPQ